MDLVDEISISGEIDAREKASLQFQTSGQLAWVGVKEGDFVKKYQVIASLDKRALKNQMAQQLNNYMKDRWTFEQAQQDNKDWQTDGMTDLARDTIKRSLEKNQFDLNNAVLDVEANDLTLKFANLWTPIEGLVTKVETPNSGVNITPASATFEVVNPKTVYLSATADQTEVTKFNVGQQGKIVLDAFEDKTLIGTVESIAFTPKTGESGTVYELKIKLDQENTDYKIRMGMTGDINFVFKTIEDALTVPTAYVKTEDGKSYVTVMNGKTKERKEVVVGETIDGNTQIVSGLNEKDVIYSN